MNATPGPWIVSEDTIKNSPDRRVHVCVTQANNQSKIVALTDYYGENDEAESRANAALIAIAPDMLEALIAIQETAIANLNGTMNADPVAAMISDILEKLINEAGIEQ